MKKIPHREIIAFGMLHPSDAEHSRSASAEIPFNYYVKEIFWAASSVAAANYEQSLWLGDDPNVEPWLSPSAEPLLSVLGDTRAMPSGQYGCLHPGKYVAGKGKRIIWQVEPTNNYYWHMCIVIEEAEDQDIDS